MTMMGTTMMATTITINMKMEMMMTMVMVVDDDDFDDDGDGGDAESPTGVHNQFSQKLNKEKGGLTARFSD